MNRIRLVRPVNSCPNELTNQALNDLITLLKSRVEVLRLVASAFGHVGFTADMRFYRTKSSGGTALVAPRGPQRIVVLSVGLSVK